MKKSTVVAPTSKGHRIFLEGIGRVGQRYNVAYSPTCITIDFVPTGKRKVVASKGGVIDLEGKKVTQWAVLTTRVGITYDNDTITIIRQLA